MRTNVVCFGKFLYDRDWNAQIDLKLDAIFTSGRKNTKHYIPVKIITNGTLLTNGLVLYIIK